MKRFSKIIDKYEVREYIKNRIGEEYLNPIYGVYDNAKDIDFNKLPDKFVIKLNNGSGYNFICKDKSKIDKDKLVKRFNRWLKIDFYKECKEIQYKNVKSKLICERYMEDSSGELRDYKFFCFEGKVKFIQVDNGRFSNHTQDMYDIDWNKINLNFGYRASNLSEERPKKLLEMIKISENLSRDLPFARIDLYYVDNRIYFGEITFTPQNGLKSFKPVKADKDIANMIKLDKYKKV